MTLRHTKLVPYFLKYVSSSIEINVHFVLHDAHANIFVYDIKAKRFESDNNKKDHNITCDRRYNDRLSEIRRVMLSFFFLYELSHERYKK